MNIETVHADQVESISHEKTEIVNSPCHFNIPNTTSDAVRCNYYSPVYILSRS